MHHVDDMELYNYISFMVLKSESRYWPHYGPGHLVSGGLGWSYFP